MNLKSTLLLVLLACGAGLWLWKGDDWGPKIGLPSNTPAQSDSKSLTALTDHFTPKQIARIEIVAEPAPFILEKTDGDIGWKIPGNWPLRKREVQELVDLLSDLRTRFQPIPIAENEDLTRYGLGAADKPLIVKATAGGTAYTLAFGEPKTTDGESSFTRSAFLRINEFPELLRLGPDVMPALRRSPDTYRRRQLFPDSERVKIASAGAASPFGPPTAGGASTLAILTDKVKEIEVRAPGRSRFIFGAAIPKTESYALKRTAAFPLPLAAEKGGEPIVQSQRIAGSWEISTPQRDRIDPERLQKILTTIPELWVEEFAADSSKAGLDKPERTITVTRADGAKQSLLIGAVAKTVEREETVSVPSPMPGGRPMPITRKISDEYRFAKLTDNPQVFVVRADRFTDLFVPVDVLRDPRLVQFTAEEVQEFTVNAPGKPPVKFIRKAEKWMIDRKPEPLAADAAAVSELVSQLAGLRSAGSEPAGDAAGGTTIAVTAQEKRPDDQPVAPPRTIVLHLGRAKLGAWPAIASASSALVAIGVGANTEAGTIGASIEGWPRVVPIEASILKAIAPEGGFRDRTLTAFTGVDKLILERDGKVFTFSKSGAIWKQTAPKEAAVESLEVEDFAASLGRLRAERYVAENPTPEDLKKYGLDAPRAKWTAFANGKDVLVLLVGGKDAEGKTYAKNVSGGSVAVLPADVSAKVLAEYRSKKVWDLDEAKVESIEVERDGKKFKLARKGTGWEDPAAPKDSIDDTAVSELLAVLGGLRAERWAGDDVKKAGLEKPSGTITLTQRDGMKRVLLLGTTVEEGIAKKQYAKVSDATAEVFVLGEFQASRLTRERIAYVEKK